MTTEYCRTPLPREARTPLGWLTLWLLVLFMSPFLGFALHGKVAAPGLVIGLLVAIVPLSSLSYLVIRRWRGLRRTPRNILEEWHKGKVIAPEGAPVVALPARFANKKNWIELRPEGIVLSSHTFLGMQGSKRLMQASWEAQQTGQLFFSWSDLVEWIVDTDSDGPDYHRVKLRTQGELKVRRFQPAGTSECHLLDAVRSVGKLPVRLLCDVECT